MLMAALAALLLPRTALAWVELDVRSHQATVDVERSGLASVAEELVLEVRGGPMHGFDLPGVDGDAELLPDATVTPTSAHAAVATPLVVDKRDDGSLRIEVAGDAGLRRGTYLFRFAYRTHLVDRARAVGSALEMSWVGPRLWDGIDAAKVVFRLPPAKQPPTLATDDADRPGASESGDATGGVFVSNLRRASDHDELEIVRLHVARGEPVVWKLHVSPDAFDAFRAPVLPASALPSGRLTERRSVWLAVAALLAAVYAASVWLKHRAYARACEACSATPRTVIPLGPWQRALLSGLALGAAVYVGATTECASGAAVLLVVAMLAAAELSPRALPRVRGPGRWEPLDPDRALAPTKTQSLPGRCLDTGTLPGFTLFALLVAGFATAAFELVSVSPYRALLVLLGASALLPIFCTGRASELPADPAAMPRPLLRWLRKKLARTALKSAPLGRIPEGADEPDELRLLVTLPRPLLGLLALEVGLEYQQGGGGPVSMPCVLVRVVDGSESYKALPRNVVWTRGRNVSERVTVLRPRLPTRSQCLSLLLRLSVLLGERPAASARRISPQAATRAPTVAIRRVAFSPSTAERPRSRTAGVAAQSSSKAASSAGRSSSTVKPGISPSPAHST